MFAPVYYTYASFCKHMKEGSPPAAHAAGIKQMFAC